MIWENFLLVWADVMARICEHPLLSLWLLVFIIGTVVIAWDAQHTIEGDDDDH